MAKEETANVAEEATEEVEATQATDEQATTEADDQLATLNQQITDLQAQLATAEDQALRAQAEIQNMTKRTKKEQAQLLKYEGQSLAKSLLPVLDNLKRALSIEVTDEHGEQLKKGIQMVHDQLVSSLKEHHVEEVDALGKSFDPNTQQAVQTVPVEDGQEPETVVEVLQAGYTLHDRVLRPAMVVVAQ
ncbi:nucleotide exchange factor GrpE [Limosilactobacillus equigenerosi]|uniref:Protein GrpE n=1 Tax=Limosilactobacillus equigenerosi DSM 18793 = JCM 14505 TaxID=1423742 RepID=A0A0R1UQC9_9LACO|nr:nucleotide exchange factor GrpE [Limosilactobacillus equigenerosi]KRL93608.1 Protein grpE (HSP-70 cofactor) [Limosilactobacillus equigenerosi DSM 18793 = JCM 14505]